jgi:alpha-tubulin suppressor-like RCC1 family protein
MLSMHHSVHYSIIIKAKIMKGTVRITVVFLLFTVNNFAQCWKEIAAGSCHSVAIKADGTLWAWGLNDKGQLGDGMTINKNIPTQIGTDNDWAVIDAEGSNSLALKIDGTLWSWGNNITGQIGDGNFGAGLINTTPTQIGQDNDWVKIACARTFAIKSNGTLWVGVIILTDVWEPATLCHIILLSKLA